MGFGNWVKTKRTGEEGLKLIRDTPLWRPLCDPNQQVCTTKDEPPNPLQVGDPDGGTHPFSAYQGWAFSSSLLSLCYLGAEMIVTETQISIQRSSSWATNWTFWASVVGTVYKTSVYKPCCCFYWLVFIEHIKHITFVIAISSKSSQTRLNWPNTEQNSNMLTVAKLPFPVPKICF